MFIPRLSSQAIQKWFQVGAVSSIFGCLVLGGVAAGCREEVSTSRQTYPFLSSRCSVAEDQKSSFMAPAGNGPTQIVIDQAFDAPDRASILRAVEEWNTLSHQMMGGDLFQAKVGTVPSAARSFDSDNCENNSLGGDVLYVISEKSNRRWKNLHLDANALAVTLRCSTSDWKLVNQVVVANTSQIKDSQFMSVILHELGHSLGLDHSCQDGAGTPTFRSCNKLDETHPYRAAVMYPKLRVYSGSDSVEIKETLRQNDEERTECLYGTR